MRGAFSMPARSTATRTARRRHLMALALSVTATIRSSARRAQASPERRHCNSDQKWRGATIRPAPRTVVRAAALNQLVKKGGSGGKDQLRSLISDIADRLVHRPRLQD